MIDHDAFEIGGDAALADALGDRVALGFQLAGGVVADRAPRLPDRRGRSGYRGCAAFSAMRHAGQRAAGADRADEAVDLAARSAPRFPGPVLSIWACRLATLSNWLAQIAPPGKFPGKLFGQAAGKLDVVVGVLVGLGRHLDQFGAVAGAARPSFPGSGSRE